MVTFCNDFAAAKNQNLICIPNRADALRDDELRTAAVRGFIACRIRFSVRESTALVLSSKIIIFGF